MQFSAFSFRVMVKGHLCELTLFDVRMRQLKIQMIENCREGNFIPRILAFRNWQLGIYCTQNCSFIPPKIIRIHFTFIRKISGDSLLTKMPAELPSTEHIFTKTSRLVPLKTGFKASVTTHFTVVLGKRLFNFGISDCFYTFVVLSCSRALLYTFKHWYAKLILDNLSYQLYPCS